MDHGLPYGVISGVTSVAKSLITGSHAGGGANEQVVNACKSSCEGDYRMCFVNCGGNIQSETHCIQNCDKEGQ
ncbi:hypothetical protein NHE_0481 [Neorickettsia helminthoeca str. Oregon]|uniref:Uncharacterized protein n=1 Tax=Neorickettsia helminthoeca str. Oregon TaxID=1286528 RepID=X5H407_9RICK|nr:hypothetical protein NHE_0481 [Neorickettsia helminthoeca str. Oregon]